MPTCRNRFAMPKVPNLPTSLPASPPLLDPVEAYRDRFALSLSDEQGASSHSAVSDDAERLDVEDVEDRSGGCLSHGQVIPGVGAPFPPCGERGRAESAAE